ncbi:MAG: ComEC/Rec2 family competence protein [Bacteroidota bacterium]|nr:ComEC/Rec2 family competence protein [Bacteroidota bacterium]
MIQWNHIPMIRLIIPLITGILVSVWIDPGPDIPFGYLLGIFILTSFLLLYGYHFISFRRRWVIGLFLQLHLMLLGVEMVNLHDDSENPSHFRNSSPGTVMIVRVTEPVIIKANSVKSIFECMSVLDSTGWNPLQGLLLAYLKKDDRSAQIHYGDILILHAGWKAIKSPKNPHEFDYQRFMKYRGVCEQVYVHSDKWERLDADRGNPILAFAHGLQHKILKILQEQGLEGEEYKVASAILAGFRSDLDPELQEAFSGAGAMHILCVSGLHVGVIYLVLSSLLSLLKLRRRTNAIRNLALIALIWFYALVTGCSPSVMRASTMITFLILGGWLRRSPNTYNTLASSACLLLLIDPYMIMAIGFQLSYLAVIGIVVIQPFLYKAVYVRYWLPDKAWAIITVSIAAQAGTFPLAIYYFHQFPNYFILTNLLVIPLSSLIIYLGFMLLFSASWYWLANCLSWLLDHTIYGMNTCIHFINDIPGAVSKGLFLNAIDCLLVYLMLIAMLVFIGQKKKSCIIIFLACFSGILISFSTRKNEMLKQQEVIVYSIRGHRAYEFIKGKEHVVIVDSVLRDAESKMLYHVKNYWIRCGLEERFMFGDDILQTEQELKNLVFVHHNFVSFSGMRFLFIDKADQINHSKKKISVDVIILSHNVKLHVGKLQNAFDFDLLVFDASNAPWIVERWQAACLESGIRCHDVNSDGAYIYRPDL